MLRAEKDHFLALSSPTPLPWAPTPQAAFWALLTASVGPALTPGQL